MVIGGAIYFKQYYHPWLSSPRAAVASYYSYNSRKCNHFAALSACVAWNENEPLTCCCKFSWTFQTRQRFVRHSLNWPRAPPPSLSQDCTGPGTSVSCDCEYEGDQKVSEKCNFFCNFFFVICFIVYPAYTGDTESLGVCG